MAYCALNLRVVCTGIACICFDCDYRLLCCSNKIILDKLKFSIHSTSLEHDYKLPFEYLND